MSAINKNQRIGGAGCLAIMVAAIVIIGQLVFRHCLWWECAPRRAFTVFDLGLPDYYFPANTETHPLQPLRGDLASIEAAGTADYWRDGLAIYSIRRFATDTQAIQRYEHEVPFRFTQAVDIDAEYSNLISYRSAVANQNNVECGYVLEDFRCVYIARYAEFTVFFSGSIGRNEMSPSDFLGIVGYLDARFKDLLR